MYMWVSLARENRVNFLVDWVQMGIGSGMIWGGKECRVKELETQRIWKMCGEARLIKIQGQILEVNLKI